MKNYFKFEALCNKGNNQPGKERAIKTEENIFKALIHQRVNTQNTSESQKIQQQNCEDMGKGTRQTFL